MEIATDSELQASKPWRNDYEGSGREVRGVKKASCLDQAGRAISNDIMSVLIAVTHRLLIYRHQSTGILFNTLDNICQSSP